MDFAITTKWHRLQPVLLRTAQMLAAHPWIGL